MVKYVLIYWIIAFILSLGSIAKGGQYFYHIGFLAMWAITAFRNVDLGGIDAGFYQIFYGQVPALENIIGWDSNYSWAYTLFNSTCKTFSHEYIFFQIIYSTVAFLLLYYIINKLELSNRQKCIFLLTFFCFRFMWDMWIILRQNIADLIYWILTIYIYKALNDKYKCFILGILAVILPAGFHTSSWINIIFLFVFYQLFKFEYIKKTYAVIIISLINFFVLSPSFADVLNMVSVIDTRYMMYANEDGSGNIAYFLARMVIVLLFFWRYNSFECKYKEYFYNMMLVMVLVGSFNVPIVVRMCDYYAIGMYGLLSCVHKLFETKSGYFINILFSILLMMIFYWFLIRLDDGQLMHYSLGINI